MNISKLIKEVNKEKDTSNDNKPNGDPPADNLLRSKEERGSTGGNYLKVEELSVRRESSSQSEKNRDSNFDLITEEEYREIVHDREDSEDEEEYRYKEYNQLVSISESFQSRINPVSQNASKKSEFIKSIVSKNKTRYVTDDFNLDLTCT